MNSVHITGRLTADPELHTSSSAKTVAEFSIAVNYRGGDEVDFFDVVAWDKQAEAIGQHLSKGRKVLVDGYLKQQKWETPEGAKRQRVEIVAQQVEFLDFRRQEGPAAEEEPF